MLRIAHSLRDLSFGDLMVVYLDGNLENGQDNWPNESEGQQLALAEQDFYAYLHDIFFPTPGAVYYVWEDQGLYVSALRMEPYQDGLLLEALETAPAARKRGFATQLIQAVLAQLPTDAPQRVYCHVSKNNEASLKTHLRCGFEITQDYSVYVDGSVNPRAYTLCWKNTEKHS